MYCKQCGHRPQEKTDTCPKCGARLSSDLEISTEVKPKVRWRVLLTAILLGIVFFVVFPRIFLQSDLETIGPTDKLRFLRAMDRSDYRRVGQRGVRVEDQTLVVIWDLRWNTFTDSKQQEIVRTIGHAWYVVGGVDTKFQIEGEDNTVASYQKDQVYLGPGPP